MQISITGHHIDVTQALKDYIDNKFSRLERHFDNMTNIHVILTVEKERQKAEATIHISRGNIYAETENDDMYAAIDRLVDKLDRQLKKHKEKNADHHRGNTALKNQELT
jgi:putative sigma-54 modulation protein